MSIWADTTGIWKADGQSTEAPPFSPALLANLTMWMDASDQSSIVSSGNNVSAWNNKSGSGFDAVQTTVAKQPDTGTTTINGLNCINFDGVDDDLDVSPMPTNFVNQPGTTFVVANLPLSGGGLAKALYTVVDIGDVRGRIVVGTVDPGNAAGRTGNSTNEVVTSTPMSGPGPRWIALRWDDAGGTIETSTGESGSYTDTTRDPCDGMKIGSQGIDRFFNSCIGEFIYYSRALSPTEMTQIKTYLNDKWGL